MSDRNENEQTVRREREREEWQGGGNKTQVKTYKDRQGAK